MFASIFILVCGFFFLPCLQFWYQGNAHLRMSREVFCSIPFSGRVCVELRYRIIITRAALKSLYALLNLWVISRLVFFLMIGQIFMIFICPAILDFYPQCCDYYVVETQDSALYVCLFFLAGNCFCWIPTANFFSW